MNLSKTLTFSFIFLVMISSPVLADEDNNSTDINETEDDDSMEEHETSIQHEFGNNVKIRDVKWESATATIVFESRTPQQVTLVDFNDIGDRGVQEPHQERITVSAGTTEHTFNATKRFGDATIIVSTGGQFVSVSNDRTSSIIPEPNSSEFVLGSIGAGLVVILVLYLSIQYIHFRANNGVEVIA